MNFLVPFQKLPQGYYRLLIIGWIIFPFLTGGVFAANPSYHSDGVTEFWVGFIIGAILYCVLGRAAIWVYDGFKSKS